MFGRYENRQSKLKIRKQKSTAWCNDAITYNFLSMQSFGAFVSACMQVIMFSPHTQQSLLCTAEKQPYLASTVS